MKVLPIALALAVPLVAGCGQALNQSSLSSGGAQSLSSAPSVRAHPDNCSYHDQKPLGPAGFLRVKICNGLVGRLYYGANSAVGLKISTQGFASNPGGVVPVPAGETPVLFIQMRVLPQDPGPASFTAPTVPPLSNRSRFTGVPVGNTYHFYAYDNSFMPIIGFPINLGSPTSVGTLFFSASPWSPLPQPGSIPVGNNVWYELTTP